MMPPIILGLLGLGKHGTLKFEAAAGGVRREVKINADFSYEDIQNEHDDDDDDESKTQSKGNSLVNIVGTWRARGAVEMGDPFDLLFMPNDDDVPAYSVDLAHDKSTLRVQAHASAGVPETLRRIVAPNDTRENFYPCSPAKNY